MAHINRKRPNTRLEIIQLGAKLFIEEGYARTTMKRISTALDLSPGNITFYFPTKEHLLAVLVNELFDFQDLLMQRATEETGKSLLAYCLELTTITAACEQNDVVREFYQTAYALESTLSLIRENDTKKTMAIFADYCPDWNEERWIATENIVSGIEYATIMTRESQTPLAVQIERALDTIMTIYQVPEETRKSKIQKVLAMDYRAMGKRILAQFRTYIEKVNEENLKPYTSK